MGREVVDFDSGWRFLCGDVPYPNTFWGLSKAGICTQGGSGEEFDDSDWEKIDLPHDFVHLGERDYSDEPPRRYADGTAMTNSALQHDPFRMWDTGDWIQNRGCYRYGIGWYRKRFRLEEADRDKRIFIEFDGVCRDSQVWCNGFSLGRHESGYTGFAYELTDFARFGGENLLAVRADSTLPEGWYYEGGGIYRHVRLLKLERICFVRHGVRIQASASPRIRIGYRLENRLEPGRKVRFHCTVFSPDGTFAGEGSLEFLPEYWREAGAELELTLNSCKFWSPAHPQLYTAVCEIESGGAVFDRVKVKFGLRSAVFDAQRGFLLNGEPLKIKGMCCHQDHAGVGTAVPDAVQEFRLLRLREMGCNAYRVAHHAPSPELADLCDRLGILLLPENRLLSSAPEQLGQLREMVCAFRNHPSVILWSLGNEETRVQFFPEGPRIVETLKHFVRQFDDRPITAALFSNYLTSGPATLDRMLPTARALDVMGFNYCDQHWFFYRAANPEQPFLVTEESSLSPVRGCYRDDHEHGKLSWLGTEKPFDFARRWALVRDYSFIAGLFIWTGFDYRGEPTPLPRPAAASSFGVMDSCGFAKDSFYYYAAQWRPEPLLHAFPPWTHRVEPGIPVPVYAFTNCDEAELLINGRTVCHRKAVDGVVCFGEFPYEPGVLCVKGSGPGSKTVEFVSHTAGEPAALRLESAFRGANVELVNVFIVDNLGVVIPDAELPVIFELTEGVLLGTGNGRPDDTVRDDSPCRTTFAGCAQAIIRRPPGAPITVRSPGLPPARLG